MQHIWPSSPRARSIGVHRLVPRRAWSGRLPVVLFSSGSGAARDIYQALAEDLASHGYLVLAIDHAGETAVQFPDGHVAGRSAPFRHRTLTEAATRVADMRLIVRRLNTMAPAWTWTARSSDPPGDLAFRARSW